ncbi:MAG: hypothetical protein PVJ67_02045 [Candidatus Pacearchaeota archaeon]|jgi:sugar phosphate isomerase/epimerase
MAYEIKNIYQGGYSSLDPNKNSLSPSNYPVTAGQFGLTTDFRSANILKEVTDKLSSGVKHIEISPVEPSVFESIPKEHFKEVARQAKLVGATVTVHGSPQFEASGMTNQGFSELQREAVERQMQNVMDRAHDVNPDGSSPVVFHSSAGIPGSQYEWGKEGKGKTKELIIVNRETGKPGQLKPEKKFYPGGIYGGMTEGEIKEGVTEADIKRYKAGEISPEKVFKEIPLEGDGKFLAPEDRINMLNHSEWDNSLNQILFNKERADEILQRNAPKIAHLEKARQEGKLNPQLLSQFPEQKAAYDHYKNAETYLHDTDQQLQALFSKAYEYGDENQREALKIISKQYGEELKNSGQSIVGQSNAMQNLLHNLKNRRLAPKMYESMEKFASDKSAETFANTAFAGYEKVRKGEWKAAPIIAIENPPAGGALSTGKELKMLIEKSHAKFIEKAKAEGISEREARKEAEKLIGATWDVGHINMIRKFGATKENVIQESEAIKPFVKHVHLSDNFGLEHTELPMGMGNVPIKEIMEKLGKEGFEAKKVIEAGNWWQHFQTAPVQASLEAFGSGIYSMQMGPYWNQTAGLQQGYFSGYGQILPNTHFQMYGGGFSMASLPTELGGQMQGGGGSRMSGRGME